MSERLDLSEEQMARLREVLAELTAAKALLRAARTKE